MILTSPGFFFKEANLFICFFVTDFVRKKTNNAALKNHTLIQLTCYTQRPCRFCKFRACTILNDWIVTVHQDLIYPPFSV